MLWIIRLLAEHGVLLLAGTTALLALGSIVMIAGRAPIHRQRLGEITLATTLVWLVLACVPLPRIYVAGKKAQPTPRIAAADRALVAPSTGHGELAAESSVSGEGRHDSAETTSRDAPTIYRDHSSAVRSSEAVGAWPLGWRAIPAIIYLCGAVACALWLFVGWLLLASSRMVARAPDPWLQTLCHSIASEFEVRPTRLLVSKRCRRPIVYGLWRPAIMLPAELCDRKKTAQLKHVLRHELAHVHRRDAWGNLLMNFAGPLLYFHPLYWWVVVHIQFSRELIADDWAAGLSTKESYVGGLVKLLTPGRRVTFASMSVLGVFRYRSPFYRRMTMLIDRRARLATKASSAWIATALVLSMAILLSMTLLLGTPRAGAQSESADGGEKPEATADVPRVGATNPPAEKAAGEIPGETPKSTARRDVRIHHSRIAPGSSDAVASDCAIEVQIAVRSEPYRQGDRMNGGDFFVVSSSVFPIHSTAGPGHVVCNSDGVIAEIRWDGVRRWQHGTEQRISFEKLRFNMKNQLVLPNGTSYGFGFGYSNQPTTLSGEFDILLGPATFESGVEKKKRAFMARARLLPQTEPAKPLSIPEMPDFVTAAAG